MDILIIITIRSFVGIKTSEEFPYPKLKFNLNFLVFLLGAIIAAL